MPRAVLGVENNRRNYPKIEPNKRDGKVNLFILGGEQIYFRILNILDFRKVILYIYFITQYFQKSWVAFCNPAC